MTDQPPPDPIHRCRRCDAEVPHGAPYCPQCGLVQAVPAGVARRARARGRSPWLIPAIIAGALASLAGGALLSVALNPNRDPVATEPRASSVASATVSASTSAEPEPSESPTPSPSPTAAPIVNRSVAQLASAAVLRANPNDSAATLTDLAAGGRVFVVGDPEESGDQRWYRVGTFDALGCNDECGLIGWVATPISDADPVLQESAVSCPSSPMSADALAAVHPLEALHCYGRSEIEVTGVVDRRDGEYDGPYRFSPDWLAHPFTPALLRAGIGFHPVPDASLDVPDQGDEVRVRGHFEDANATSCRVSAAPDAGDIELPQPARVVLDCRATFVWTDYDVIGGE
ncbi:MAG: hypothetical protein ABIO99_04620 [Candidatus Limnocylindria bacterium]